MPFGSRWILPEKKVACLGDALLTCLVRYEVEGYNITPVILSTRSLYIALSIAFQVNPTTFFNSYGHAGYTGTI